MRHCSCSPVSPGTCRAPSRGMAGHKPVGAGVDGVVREISNRSHLPSCVGWGKARDKQRAGAREHATECATRAYHDAILLKQDFSLSRGDCFPRSLASLDDVLACVQGPCKEKTQISVSQTWSEESLPLHRSLSRGLDQTPGGASLTWTHHSTSSRRKVFSCPRA